MAALLGTAVVLIVAGVGYWLYARHFEWTDDAFIDGHIVQVAPKVAGYVVELNVDDNQLVKQGDLLLRIDPRDFDVALADALESEAAAAGRLRQAEVQIASAQAQASAAEAEVKAAQATAKNAHSDLERHSNLAPRGAVSMQSLDAATATARSTAADQTAAEARSVAAQSQIKLARSQRATLESEWKEAQVQIKKARLNRSYAEMYAPISGRVTHRGVELGDYVRPSQALFALVDPRVWVTANFKETQLTFMRVGQKVEIRIDAYPGQKLLAHVDSFQRGSGARFSVLPPENATGNYVKVVQRVPVKIVFDEPLPTDLILGPGMSVVPRVTVR
ncbi:MAG TPA: HlyD family secretion protein [Pirellulales bacterium]|jgi:membrane fusion protein (multidrug efflux system)|nr:HlyD family secretion protein [Pirellulales bacterium]